VYLFLFYLAEKNDKVERLLYVYGYICIGYRMKTNCSGRDVCKLILAFILTVLLVLSNNISIRDVEAQGGQWSSPKVMPGFDPNAWPPILISDQYGIVHAFTDQWIDDGSEGRFRAIVYNQWTLERGWTNPVDILLSPSKEARLTDVHLDNKGMFHLVFWGGDNTEAGIYYSRADSLNAYAVNAWEFPSLVAEDAGDPEGAVVAEDDQGNILIVYHGRMFGNGVYVIKSQDGGATWSRPIQIFLGTPAAPLISEIQVIKSRSGWLHAVWNLYNIAGQGRGVYYSRSLDGLEWSDPVPLAITPDGLGVRDMTMIELGETVLVTYVLPGVPSPKFIMRSSIDDGLTWKDPSIIFPRHVGANGPGSLVIDGNNGLHIFFGQRISGSPDIHGMWHSTWMDNRWMEPEAVVKGPSVMDPIGDKSFDPFAASAVVSQGNVILVTWRTDPGSNANGVWYSYKVLDIPASPVTPPPPRSLSGPISIPVPTSTSSSSNDGSAQAPGTDPTLSVDPYSPSVGLTSNTLMAISVTPAIILILALFVIKIRSNRSS
jgi:hypothetical protein